MRTSCESGRQQRAVSVGIAQRNVGAGHISRWADCAETNFQKHGNVCAQVSGILRCVLHEELSTRHVPVSMAFLHVTSGMFLFLFFLFFFAFFSVKAFPGRDVLYTAPGSRHIVVLSGNLVYSLDVIAADGSPVAQSDILFALNEIRSGAKCSSLGVGSLTALSRDDWAKARPRLVETGDNKRLLERLESAVLALCLDEREVGESAATSAQVFLHGRHNRWYDKSLQLIVSSDGKAAVNFEHSWGDGVSVLRYANEICEDSFENQVSKIHKDRKGNNNIKPQLLDFNLSSVQTELVIADEWLKQKGESLTAAELRVNGFGKSFFKSRKIAPDGVVQNAIQLAYKRAFGSTVAT
jgi:carnitine O-palmitoyltransferase 2